DGDARYTVARGCGRKLRVDTGPVGRQVQLLVARDHFVAQARVEVYAVLVYERLDGVVVALGLNPHQLRQKHPDSLAHLVEIFDDYVMLPRALDELDRAGLVHDVARDELTVALVVFLYLV